MKEQIPVACGQIDFSPGLTGIWSNCTCGQQIVHDPDMAEAATKKWPDVELVFICMSCAAAFVLRIGAEKVRKDSLDLMPPEMRTVMQEIPVETIAEEFVKRRRN